MAATADKVLTEARTCDLQKVEALLGGVRVLSCRLDSALDAHELLLSGLPTSALNHLLGHWSSSTGRSYSKKRLA